MNDKPKRNKFQPKASGSKKKKKKKRGNKPNNAPQSKPNFSQTIHKPQTAKPRPKRKRRTHFEADMDAPMIEINGGFNRNQHRNTNRNSRNTRDPNAPNTANIARRPRGTRAAVKSSHKSNPMRKNYKVSDLEKAERTHRTRVFAPQILEDNSGDETEKKEIMDLDMSNSDKSEDNTDFDPWNEGNDDIKYTPITLKKKPNYGKNGVFSETEMLNVFSENEDIGNKFMFIQMPPVLPLVSHLNEDEKLDLKMGKKMNQTLLRQMGEGNIGKIRIRQSGKTELVIGDYVMEVNFASPMDCHQQVMHIHAENARDRTIKGKAQFLGNVPPQSNLVCSYRAEDLLL